MVETALPINKLKASFHKFDAWPHPANAYYWTQLRFTCTGAHDGVAPVLPFQTALGAHAVTEVEIAADITVDFENVAAALTGALRLLSKRRHQRGHIVAIYNPDQFEPPQGLLPYPTFYLEDKDMSVRMKLYARKAKRVAKKFDSTVIRIEWTLMGDAITRQLRIPGRTLADLAKADLVDFVRRNLSLARVDLAKLGRLFLSSDRLASLAKRKPDDRYMPVGMSALDYWSMRAGALFLIVRGHRDADQLGGNKWAEKIALTNPAQVRGYLRELQRREEANSRALEQGDMRRKRRFTDYRIRQIVGTIPQK